MTRYLLITQRHSRDRHGSLVDSLENGYVDCFSSLGFTVVPVPNSTPHPATFVAAFAPVALVLSGGGDVDPKFYGKEPALGQSISQLRDSLEFSLLDAAVRDRLPVFAICRGMQLINVYFGGGLDSETLPAVHAAEGLLASHQVLFDDQMLQQQFPDGCEVNSYHREAVPLDGLGKGIVAFARHCSLPLAEGIRHSELPIAGVQWHPERSSSITPIDHQLLEAFRDRKLFWEVRN